MNIEINNNKIYTGINAIDNYENDEESRIPLLARKMNKAVKNIALKTGISEEKLIENINSKLTGIEFDNDREAVIASVNHSNHTLVLGVDFFNTFMYKDNDTDNIIQYELAHLLGGRVMKNPLSRTYISGYRTCNKYPIIGFRNDRNKGFNDAAVEMFTESDKDYREIEFLGYKFQTNIPDYNHKYQLNANLIEQMLIANGTDKKDLFDGLFDYEKSKEFISKFDKKTFKTVSAYMTDIWNLLKLYNHYDSHIFDNPGFFMESIDVKLKLNETLAQAERTIIDNILTPNLKDKRPEEKQSILENYSKFLIYERKYFSEKTGFKIDFSGNDEKEKRSWRENIAVPQNCHISITPGKRNTNPERKPNDKNTR